MTQLRRWEKQVNSNGSRNDKCNLLDEAVGEKFSKAVSNHANVRELHIRKWGTQLNKKIGLENFLGPRSWSRRFQNAHRFVSRKVPKFVTDAYAQSIVDIESAATKFVDVVISLVETDGPSSLYNTDQSGFQLAIHSGRTLADKGEKKVLAMVQSASATTHS